MFSPTHSNISQNNIEMLEEQYYEMQWWHEKEQQFLLHLQEAVEACCAEHAAQKARREAEAKAKEEAEKWRIAEEKKLEYIQWLWDKVIAEDTTLLKGAERSQVAGSKCREILSENDMGHWPFKKAKGKQPARYWGDMGIKLGGSNLCERCVCTR